MKLCVLFPGIGYTCDKPLLYYSGRLARAAGYEVIPLIYSGFPAGAKGNEEKMRMAASHALAQSEEQLDGICWERYGQIVFIGKSIGTAACLGYRALHELKARCILLTPLALTFEQPSADCTAFHGTADPWADTAEIRSLSERYGVPLFEYPQANHSLETGDVRRDLGYLTDAAERISELL